MFREICVKIRARNRDYNNKNNKKRAIKNPDDWLAGLRGFLNSTMTILHNSSVAVNSYITKKQNNFYGADLATFSSLEHFDFLHSDQAGTVIVWQKLEKNAWHKITPTDTRDLILDQVDKEDRYLTVNEFSGWRQISLLKSLRALFVDIDNPRLTVHYILSYCAENYIPEPTLILMSGRGAHLYWLLKPEDRNKLGLWQLVENHLISEFAEIGADPAAKDCTRVLRLADTINSKNKVKTQGYIINEDRHDLVDFASEYLPATIREKSLYSVNNPPVIKTVPHKAIVRDIATKQKSRKRTGSIYDWWHLVYRDLIMIAEHHFPGGKITEGSRDNWLFLMSVALSWFTHAEAIESEIAFTASQYLHADDVKETLRGMSSAIERAHLSAEGKTIKWNGQERDARYHYRRETLLEKMSEFVTPDLIPKLRAIIPADVREARRQEREDARYASRHKGDKEKAQAVLMRQEGMKITEIAKHFGVTRMTVHNWLKASHTKG
tara:strand:- start:69 stop:1550 length:1482 start_codon:yes stop_codon:yes gene_type:complete